MGMDMFGQPIVEKGAGTMLARKVTELNGKVAKLEADASKASYKYDESQASVTNCLRRIKSLEAENKALREAMVEFDREHGGYGVEIAERIDSDPCACDGDEFEALQNVASALISLNQIVRKALGDGGA